MRWILLTSTKPKPKHLTILHYPLARKCKHAPHRSPIINRTKGNIQEDSKQPTQGDLLISEQILNDRSPNPSPNKPPEKLCTPKIRDVAVSNIQKFKTK